MNLTLVPYGNAGKAKGGNVTCQHGKGECEGNRWEQCAIAHYPDPKQHYPFYYCMEKAGSSFMLQSAKKCATFAKLDYDTLSTCWNGKESMQLQQHFGDLTPPHSYVPWVLVNGKLYNLEKKNFLKYVCSVYKGKKPAGCKKAEAAPLTLTEIPDLDISSMLLTGGGTTHYGDPEKGCESDEMAFRIDGIKGDVCVPKCTGTTCPTDKPAGVTASPQCALQSSSGDKYCVLICSPSAEALSFPVFKRAADAQCGTNASCKAIQSVGICTYDD